jgi:hypothetical protein
LSFPAGRRSKKHIIYLYAKAAVKATFPVTIINLRTDKAQRLFAKTRANLI